MFEAQSKAIEQLNKQLSKTVIKAPFSGIIDNVIVKKGEVVYPGRSNLMLLVNMQITCMLNQKSQKIYLIQCY